MRRTGNRHAAMLAVADENDSPPELRDAEVGGSHDVERHGVVERREQIDEAVLEPHVLEAQNVFKEEPFGLKLPDDAVKLAYEQVARVMSESLADRREALARWPADHPVWSGGHLGCE